MFGYVQIRKPELKIKDYETYHGFYCGLCEKLREKYGITGQITLSFDMTFLVILLTSVYNKKVSGKKQHCLVHPAKKHLMLTSEISEYAADITMILSYYKCRDEWVDDHNFKGLAGMKMYRSQCEKLAGEYPEQFRAIRHNLKRLAVLEKRNCEDVKEVADCFGRLMAGIFIKEQDGFAGYLGEMGYYLGRYIYIMDAYDDLKDDIKNGDYNPLKHQFKKEGFEEKIQQILLDEIAASSRAFELLPCVEYADILRNIMYAGVWNKFDNLQKKK